MNVFQHAQLNIGIGEASLDATRAAPAAIGDNSRRWLWLALAMVLLAAIAGLSSTVRTRELPRSEGDCCNPSPFRIGQWHQVNGVWNCQSAQRCNK